MKDPQTYKPCRTSGCRGLPSRVQTSRGVSTYTTTVPQSRVVSRLPKPVTGCPGRPIPFLSPDCAESDRRLFPVLVYFPSRKVPCYSRPKKNACSSNLNLPFDPEVSIFQRFRKTSVSIILLQLRSRQPACPRHKSLLEYKRQGLIGTRHTPYFSYVGVRRTISTLNSLNGLPDIRPRDTNEHSTMSPVEDERLCLSTTNPRVYQPFSNFFFFG